MNILAQYTDSKRKKEKDMIKFQYTVKLLITL